jgi:hypothetical protein
MVLQTQKTCQLSSRNSDMRMLYMRATAYASSKLCIVRKELQTYENASIAKRPFLISLSSYFAAAAGVLEKFSGSVVGTSRSNGHASGEYKVLLLPLNLHCTTTRASTS